MTIVRRAWVGDIEITDYPYALRFGADLGNAEGEAVTLESLLADGQIESLVRRLNRGMTIGVIVEGADLAEVQANEAALVVECDRNQNTFTLDLGDGFAEPMVFDTTLIEPERVTGEGSDAHDMAGLHLWALSIKAHPYWRTATTIIDDAGTPPSSSGTLLYNCESTTGWSKWSTNSGSGGSNIGTAIAVDNVIYAEGAGSIRTESNASYNRSGAGPWDFTSADKVEGLSLSTDTGGYLSIAIKTAFTAATSPPLQHLWMTTTAGGEAEVTNFVATTRDAEGFTRIVWPVASGLTVTGLRFEAYQLAPGIAQPAGKAYVWYDDVELLPAASVDHQIVKQLQVQGSARTTGSLRVSSPNTSVPLGYVLAATMPTGEIKPGFQIDGRRWVSQGTTTTDTTALGGSYLTPDASTYSTAAGKPIFDVPVNMLTAGPYTMVALALAESASLTFGVQSQLRIGSTNVGPTSAAEVSVNGLTTGWQFVTVGTVYMPPVPMQGADELTSKVRLLFKGAKMADVYFIPAWQVGGRPVADFSIVDCGSGTVAPGGASSSLWIDSPSVANDGLGAWWRGPTTDRTNVQSAWPDAKKTGVHTFRPGSLTAFLVSTGAAGPTLALEYPPRFL